MKLLFRSKNIRKFEEKHGSFMSKLAPKVGSLILLIRLGSDNCTDDEASDMLDTEMYENEKDMIDVLESIMWSLRRPGFLLKDVSIRKYIDNMRLQMSLVGEDEEVPEQASEEATKKVVVKKKESTTKKKVVKEKTKTLEGNPEKVEVETL